MNGFEPIPPNIAFPIRIPENAPTTTIHHGEEGGKVIASKSPVTEADRSFKDGFFLKIKFPTTSAATEETTETTTTSKTLAPKIKILPMRAGIKAIITSLIITVVFILSFI